MIWLHNGKKMRNCCVRTLMVDRLPNREQSGDNVSQQKWGKVIKDTLRK